MDDAEMAYLRADNLERILSSNARKKVIVAGPGTGKSFTFKNVVERVTGPILVLSFLGNLVVDLERSLGDRAVVRTFHSYCRGLLHNMDVPGITRGVDYFPEFKTIVTNDLQLIRDSFPDEGVDQAFMNLDDVEHLASDAIGIGNYYDAVGHTDSVYRVYLSLATHPLLIPVFGQVLVDEFQDFSLLEASLIGQLATVSPTLIVGDDDQALYAFKHASADYLRELFRGGDYVQFELPFCTRCTQVLVAATHLVIARAQESGLLNGRIDKTFLCYLPEKRAASERYPRIRHARCTVERNSAPYMCRFVAQEIGNIDPADIALSHSEGNPTVLVIAPPQFARRIFGHLQAEGCPNLEFGSRTQTEIEILDGYRRLVKDDRSRLGWRLVLHSVQPPGWQDVVRRALLENADLSDLLSPQFRDLHLAIVELHRRLLTGDVLGGEDIMRLEAATGLPFATLRRHLGLDDVDVQQQVVVEAPRIIITSMVGAKGLQAEHVFVVGVSERHFPLKNGAPTDDEVCQLLVALTRARQSCTLVSCGRFGQDALPQSIFLEWLDPLLETLHVNAAYWNS